MFISPSQFRSSSVLPGHSFNRVWYSSSALALTAILCSSPPKGADVFSSLFSEVQWDFCNLDQSGYWWSETYRYTMIYSQDDLRYSGVFSFFTWSIGLAYSETCRPGDMGHHCFLPRCYNQCRNTALCNICLKNSCWFYSSRCLL